MTFTLADLHYIIATAATLSERLHRTAPLASVADPDDALQAIYFAQWQALFNGEHDKFEKRVQWEDLTPAESRARLGKVQSNETDPLPEWAEFLRVALTTLDPIVPSYRFLNPDILLPFEDVFAPFIETARRQMLERVGSSAARIAEAAQISVERDVLQRLSGMFWQALNLEFNLFNVRNAQGSYQDFVQHLRSDGFVTLFRRYPVMARLLGQTLIFWINATAEFYQRLAEDWLALEQLFNDGAALHQVVEVRTGLSDMHHQHRTVIVVAFDNGLRVVYKPKPLGLEAAYYKLLHWINEHGAPLGFKVLALLERANYGWIEFVEHQACYTDAELYAFFKRAGMLLCIIHVLRGTDAHSENVIASGAYPVLIDAETLFTPIIHQLIEVQSSGLIGQNSTVHSVLTTAFLPEWRTDVNGNLYDISALGHRGGHLLRRPVWENINTESMRLRHSPTRQPASANSPFATSDSVLGLENFVETILDGFRLMYQFIIDHRAELMTAQDSPLVAFQDQPVRFLFRQTWIYGRLIEKSMAAESLMDGLRFSLTFEPLSKALLLFQHKPLLWQVYLDEISAISQFDVPYFAINTSSVDYVGKQDNIAYGLFEQSGYAACLSYIGQLDEADLAAQVGYIKGAVYAQIATDKLARQDHTTSASSELQPHQLAPLTQDELMAYARQIGDELCQHAVSVQGTAYWISFDMADNHRYRYQPMGYSLYGGMMGVTVFMAALDSLCGGYRAWVDASLQPLFRHMQDDIRSVIKGSRLGGGDGTGSLIYGLALIGTLLHESTFIEQALALARHLPFSDIDTDDVLDVVGGSAGLLLSLLALYRVAPAPEVLDRAVVCGRHLLAKAKPSKSGLRAWPTQQGQLLGGFAHGAAGISLSLLRLYEVSGLTEFLTAATEAVQYEQTLFLDAQQNWRDILADTPDQTIFGLNWCHGAPGIALARLSGLASLDAPLIRRDIDAGIKIAVTFYRRELDQCCCGIMGKVETLLIASQQFDQPSLLEGAKRWAAYATQRAERNEGYRSFGNVPTSIRNFGFFQGTSGIGYELLRLASPDKLPSVLSWQVHP